VQLGQGLDHRQHPHRPTGGQIRVQPRSNIHRIRSESRGGKGTDHTANPLVGQAPGYRQPPGIGEGQNHLRRGGGARIGLDRRVQMVRGQAEGIRQRGFQPTDGAVERRPGDGMRRDQKHRPVRDRQRPGAQFRQRRDACRRPLAPARRRRAQRQRAVQPPRDPGGGQRRADLLLRRLGIGGTGGELQHPALGLDAQQEGRGDRTRRHQIQRQHRATRRDGAQALFQAAPLLGAIDQGLDLDPPGRDRDATDIQPLQRLHGEFDGRTPAARHRMVGGLQHVVDLRIGQGVAQALDNRPPVAGDRRHEADHRKRVAVAQDFDTEHRRDHAGAHRHDDALGNTGRIDHLARHLQGADTGAFAGRGPRQRYLQPVNPDLHPARLRLPQRLLQGLGRAPLDEADQRQGGRQRQHHGQGKGRNRNEQGSV